MVGPSDQDWSFCGLMIRSCDLMFTPCESSLMKPLQAAEYRIFPIIGDMESRVQE